jgi:hypothetical protein
LSLAICQVLVVVLAMKAQYYMAVAGLIGLIDHRMQRWVVVLLLLFLCRSSQGVKWV